FGQIPPDPMGWHRCPGCRRALLLCFFCAILFLRTNLAPGAPWSATNLQRLNDLSWSLLNGASYTQLTYLIFFCSYTKNILLGSKNICFLSLHTKNNLQ
uniref:Uncharacterized protein n=1 Tax=Aegilops tauschii subsp. strangulata TaxID=200361 RepID=A0A453QZP3_AEGTS